MPEIMDGKNIADFIDPDIMEKLEALEREEERLQAEGYYDDEEDVFEEYMHERLPSQPAQLDLELPESNLDLTMTFQSILEEVAPEPE